MKTLAIIPARMASTRYPDKPMVKIAGIPMIGHICYRAKSCREFDEICVATCDEEIRDYIKSLGFHVVMTSDQHPNCIDRSAEALKKFQSDHQTKVDIAAIIQGDEPLIMPAPLEQAVQLLKNDENLPVVNVIAPIETIDEFQSDNIVKVVTDLNHDIIYMSREPIPTLKREEKTSWYKQTGIIFFKSPFLEKFIHLKPGPNEICEKVDMLRVIEHGHRIKSLVYNDICLGVDVPEDRELAEKHMLKDELFKQYGIKNE